MNAPLIVTQENIEKSDDETKECDQLPVCITGKEENEEEEIIARRFFTTVNNAMCFSSVFSFFLRRWQKREPKDMLCH